ncbi:D-3-phosphoglycerate dehydrogenase-like [Denticeps clupeoides]|nr:D-3-phosphoglycerate dehydrogenase-like [Denticeps clupeoides]
MMMSRDGDQKKAFMPTEAQRGGASPFKPSEGERLSRQRPPPPRTTQQIKMSPVSIQRVLISESVDPRCRSILQENGIEVTERQNMSKDELLAEIKNYDGLIVRSATKVTAEVVRAAGALKIIGRAGTGVDNVDVDAATKNGVIVMNTPGGNTISAAELTCALVLSLSRNVAQADMSMKAGKWDRKKFMGSELFGKVLGIVGLGRIGKEVATRMQSFGMRTIGYDPITPPDVSAAWGVEQMSLEQLWPQCDYITVHTPLMPSTTGLLNDETLAKCKKGVKVVNCARGGIIDEEALLRALESGQCGGAGLDVYVEEPPMQRALVNHPNVISCPHLGASTKEAQARCGQEIALQIVDMVKGKALVGAVNAQVLASTFSPESHLWIRLGEAMGSVLRAYTSSKQPYSKVQVTTLGERLKKSTEFLSSAVVVGLITDGSSHGANLVNALALAKETGLSVSRNHEEAMEGLDSAACVVEVSLCGCGYKALGSVQAGVPVLLQLDGCVFRQPVSLAGHLLFFKAESSPQLLPSVTGALAAGGVEMESFSASAASGGEQWFCVGMSSLLGDLASLRSLVKEAAQLTV